MACLPLLPDKQQLPLLMSLHRRNLCRSATLCCSEIATVASALWMGAVLDENKSVIDLIPTHTAASVLAYKR